MTSTMKGLAALAMILLAQSAWPLGAAAQTLIGAGSTFVAPAMTRWAASYQKAHPGVTISYQPVGSGQGIDVYKAGAADFAATDVPLSDKQMAQLRRPSVHIPVVAGAVVLAYNVPGVASGLRLSGDLIADIFLGAVKTWNDPRLQKQNPTLKLPALPIVVCRRSDSSGTTYVFTDYLSTTSPAWGSGVGKGKTVAWRAGLPAIGNNGVAALIKENQGAIGYVELAYAVRQRLSFGPIRNKAGRYVPASAASTAAAVAAATERMRKDVRVSLVDGPGANAYPICGVVYVLVPDTPGEGGDAAKSRAVADFLRWVLGPGQGAAQSLLYAPLPKPVTTLTLQALARAGTANK